MLTLNKYLRELGIDENTWPFDEIKLNQDRKNKHQHYDGRYVEEDGMVDAETFNLSTTLAMIIYSYLCYFRDGGLKWGYPVCFNFKNGKELPKGQGYDRWCKIIDRMIESFRMLIKYDEEAPDILEYSDKERWKKDIVKYNKKINYGLRLFAKYFSDLWW